MSRTSRIIGGVLMATLAGCAPRSPAVPAPAPAAGHTAGEEAAVLAVADAFMRALTAGDRAAMAALQLPDAMTYRASVRPGQATRVAGTAAAAFSDPSRPANPPMRERYWTPTVLVRHAIAVMWAPYEFWVDGATSHCGIDVFTFAKVDGQWRLANLIWTVEPAACEELRALGAEGMRPRD
jgi:hypothetical protein